MITVTIDSPRADLAPDWDDLVARASSNVFMNPAALVAADETHFADIRVLLAWVQEGGKRKLAGVWALQLKRFAPLWPAVLEALPPFDLLRHRCWLMLQPPAKPVALPRKASDGLRVA